jgi:hypothetical protein
VVQGQDVDVRGQAGLDGPVDGGPYLVGDQAEGGVFQ